MLLSNFKQRTCRGVVTFIHFDCVVTSSKCGSIHAAISAFSQNFAQLHWAPEVNKFVYLIVLMLDLFAKFVVLGFRQSRFRGIIRSPESRSISFASFLIVLLHLEGQSLEILLHVGIKFPQQ